MYSAGLTGTVIPVLLFVQKFEVQNIAREQVKVHMKLHLIKQKDSVILFILLCELLITYQGQYQSCTDFKMCSVPHTPHLSPHLVKEKSKKYSLWISCCNSHINILNHFMTRILRSHLRYTVCSLVKYSAFTGKRIP